MNTNAGKRQPTLVSNDYCKKSTIGILAAMITAISSPALSNTVSTTGNVSETTQTTLVLSNKSSKSPSKEIYICSPAGFGKKSSCYKR